MSDDRRKDDHPDNVGRRREDVQELLLATLREQLDLTKQMRREGSEGFRNYRKRAKWGFAFLACVSALAMYLVWQQGQSIQEQRKASILAGCREQNMRHDQTIRRLDDLLAVARRTASPERVKRIEASRAGTTALITALAPKRDCVLLVRKSVKS